MSDFEIKRADEGERDLLLSLLGLLFPDRLLRRYEWLYQGNPHGEARTWLAIHRPSGEAAACTSVFPRRVMVCGRMRTGSIGGDCIVRPEYRRRGLATELHRASLAWMRAGGGVEFMYGPPVPHNLAALLKAGAHLVSDFGDWVRPLSAQAVAQALGGGRLSAFTAGLTSLSLAAFDRMTRQDRDGLALEPVSNFGPEFDALFRRAAPTHRIVCVRDVDYLRWRYFGCAADGRQRPFAARRRGELLGFVALEVAGRRAVITDLFAPADASITGAILQAAVDQASAAGCSTLAIGTNRGPLAGHLRRLGFFRRDQRGFQVLAAADDPQLESLTARGAWHFCTADQDMEAVLRRGDEASLEAAAG